MRSILSIQTQDELGFDNVESDFDLMEQVRYASKKCQLCWGLGELKFTHPVNAIVLCNCVIRNRDKRKLVYDKERIWGGTVRLMNFHKAARNEASLRLAESGEERHHVIG